MTFNTDDGGSPHESWKFEGPLSIYSKYSAPKEGLFGGLAVSGARGWPRLVLRCWRHNLNQH